MEYNKLLYDITGIRNAHFWYVMDYSENTVFGKLVNLKEKFFSKIATMYMQELPRMMKEAISEKGKRA